MRGSALAALLLAGCSGIADLETAAVTRAKAPIVVPIVSGTLDPLCWKLPLMFWERKRCV